MGKNDIKAVLKIGEEQDYFTYAGESCTIDNARLSVAKEERQMSDLRKLILIMTGLKNWQLNIL